MWLILLLLIGRATGALLIFSGVGKLVWRQSFLISLQALSFLPRWVVTLVVTILPWFELAIGSMLVTGLFAPYAAGVALALLLAFSITAIVAVMRGMNVPCSCFGAASQSPLSWGTVLRNTFLGVLLLPLILMGHASPVSMSAMLGSSMHGSLTDMMLIASVPLCLALAAIVISMVQGAVQRKFQP